MRHIMNALDLSVEELDDLITLAEQIMKNPDKYSQCCNGKKLATCFYVHGRDLVLRPLC